MDSDDSSASVQRRALKHCKRRIIYSSEEEDSGLRQEECPEAQACSSSTHSEQVPAESSPLQLTAGWPGSLDKTAAQSQEGSPASPDEVIILCTNGNSSPWQSDQSTDSDTDTTCSTESDTDTATDSDSDTETESESSTPAYKRGIHPSTDQIARQEILEKGMKMRRVPRWMRVRRGPTTLILTDAYLKNWSDKDCKCKAVYRPEFDTWKWIAVIRSRELDLRPFLNVVMCFSKIKSLDGLQLRNTVQSIARAVRMANHDCRIFFANLPPTPQSPPVLGRRISAFNADLLEAVHSVGKKMLKVHLITVHEHLMDKTGKILSPVRLYFKDQQEFTKLGCALFREIIMREAGMKPYWF